MGRLFVIELQGPVYKCKQCQTDLGLPDDIISRQAIYRRLHKFSRVFNVFLIPATSPFMRNDILCVCCSTRIGSYLTSILYTGNVYFIFRNKLHGPEGSDDED